MSRLPAKASIAIVWQCKLMSGEG